MCVNSQSHSSALLYADEHCPPREVATAQHHRQAGLRMLAGNPVHLCATGAVEKDLPVAASSSSLVVSSPFCVGADRAMVQSRQHISGATK